MGLEVKKGEYAKLKGWAPSYITKLISKGVVVLTADRKRVDVEASDAALVAAAQVDRQGVREANARERLAAAIDPRFAAAGEAPYPNNGAAAPSQGSAGATRAKSGGDFDLFNRARAAKEDELAQLARLERQEREGALVSVDSVKAAAAKLAGVIAQGLDQVAPRLATKLAAETDERKCALLLDKEVREIREAMAREIRKIAGEEAPPAASSQ